MEGETIIFFRFGTFTIRDGCEVRFLEDTWLGNALLSSHYLGQYYIIRHNFFIIRKILESIYPQGTAYR
jgi:hypothetical protein